MSKPIHLVPEWTPGKARWTPCGVYGETAANIAKTTDPTEVTCKNCLRVLRAKGEPK